jgi:hypothetical protein
MVDRRARNVAAEVIREFMEGSISNREYEGRYPNSKDDPVLWEIFVQIWFLYSDLKEHTLTGKHVLKRETRSFLDRCILYLKSDCDFQWSRQRFRPWLGLCRVLGLGRFIIRLEGKEMTTGDAEVWPFFKKAEYEEIEKYHLK